MVRTGAQGSVLGGSRVERDWLREGRSRCVCVERGGSTHRK